MDIEKLLMKLFYSKIPENYARILVRWEAGEKNDKLIYFAELISNKWEEKPVSGRFYNKDKWRDIDFFYKVLNILKISEEQLKTLRSYEIVYNSKTINFIEAQNLINDKEKQLEELKRIENDRIGNLPITSYSFNKLKEYGIDVSKTITRFEGEELISQYRMEKQLNSILNDFSKNNKNISEKIRLVLSEYDSDEQFDFIQCLEELNGYCKEFNNYGYNYILPDNINLVNVDELINKLDVAQIDLEDAIDQIKDRFFSTLEGDFKVIGRLPKNNFKKLGFFILDKILNDNEKYDFDDDILELIVFNFPDVKIKADYY